jgi:hypothetical protein
MKKTSAIILFLIICIALAALLLTHRLSSVVAGGLFALSLLVLGVLSSGFRK